MQSPSQRSELACRCAELLPPSPSPPLLAALTLLRLGLQAPSRNVLLRVAANKLRATASTLPFDTRLRLERELSIAFNISIPPQIPSSTKRIRSHEPPFVLPLSGDAVWQGTKDFYTSHGSGVFTSGSVPSHVSTSTFLARAYADVIECMLIETGEALPLASGGEAEPVYVLDVGCGAGVLGVRVALELSARQLQQRRSFCVILCDLDPAAALAQAALPSADVLRREGLLDVARFDADVPLHTLSLILSGRVLAPGRRQPLIVLASYLFDSLPIDIIRVRPGHEPLEVLNPTHRRGRRGGKETRFAYVTAPTRPAQPSMNESDGEDRQGRTANCTRPRLDELCQRLVALAADDAESRGEPAAAILPTGAARCMWWLHEWLVGGDGTRADYPALLLLIGDKIVDRHSAARLVGAHRGCHEPSMSLRDLPIFDRHGGPAGALSSCLVLDGVLEALRLCGSTHSDDDLAASIVAPRLHQIGQSPPLMEFDICAVALTPGTACGSAFDATRKEFARRLGSFGPAEMERLCAFVHSEATAGASPSRVPLRLVCDVLTLSHFDWATFYDWRWLIRMRIHDEPPDEASYAVNIACECFSRRVVLDAAEWAASALGFMRWLCSVGEWARALLTHDEAQRDVSTTSSSTEQTTERIFLEGVCHQRMGKMVEAARLLGDAARRGHRGAARRERRMQSQAVASNKVCKEL